MRYAYIAVEGPHDLEFIARLLKHEHGLGRVQKLTDLDGYWTPLVPTTFPPYLNDDEDSEERDLLGRVNMPMFFQIEEGDLSIAIHPARSDSKIAKTIEESLSLLSSQPFAVAVVLDADGKDPVERFESMCTLLAERRLPTPSVLAKIEPGPPRCGVFVLPDNENPGTLEDILIECAEVNYPSLLGRARGLVGSIDRSSEEGLRKEGLITKRDREPIMKPAGAKKATVACISAVMRPGMALQNTIHHNRWLEGEALKLPRVAAVQRFLTDLLA